MMKTARAGGTKPRAPGERTLPLVVAVEMGYGHLRAARPLAHSLGVPLLRLDREPLASPQEARLWKLARWLYESLSRGSQVPVVGGALRSLLEAMTAIATPPREASAPVVARAIDVLVRAGLGGGLVRSLRETGATLLTTYFVPALIADRAGFDCVCVVTDADLARAWVPPDPLASRIRYCVPGERARQRLRSYGVPGERIEVTGFPLPRAISDPADAALPARLARLDPSGAWRRRATKPASLAGPGAADPGAADPGAPLLVFAVGGAGAQAHVALPLLLSLRPLLLARALRLTLVAGTRAPVAAAFRAWIRDTGTAHLLGSGLEILHEPDLETYFVRFDALLAETDILWTKPSELMFYAASGLALLLGPPVGAQETANLEEALAAGAALQHGDPARAGEWLTTWLADGRLAGVADSAHRRYPRRGTQAIRAAALRDTGRDAATNP